MPAMPKPIPVSDPVNPQPMHPAKEKISAWLNSYMPTIMNKITSGAAKPTDISGATTEPGVSKMLYEAVHPDTFNRVMDLFGKPSRLLDDGTQDDPLRPGESAIVGGRGPERLAIDTGGAAHVEPLGNKLPFQDWYSAATKKTGINPNPDDPRHFYDYRAAYNAGVTGPNQEGHWPSQFKLEGHPNQIVNGIDTRTGQPLPDIMRPPGPEGWDPYLQGRQVAGIPEQTPGAPQTFRETPLYQHGIKPIGDVLLRWNAAREAEWRASQGLPPLPSQVETTGNVGSVIDMQKDPATGSFVAPPYTGPRPYRVLPEIQPGPSPMGEEWQHYGEGIDYKRGPENVRGDELARQRIMGLTAPGGAYIPGIGRYEGTPTPERSYYDVHPEERAMDDIAMANAPPRGMAEYERNVARMRMTPAERLQQDKADTEERMQRIIQGGETGRARLQYGPGSPGAEEKLAHANYLRMKPELDALQISEQGRTHLEGINRQVAGHIEAAKIAAEIKDPIMKEIGTIIAQGQKQAEMYGGTFDAPKVIGNVLRAYRAMGYITDEQWNKMPAEYKETQWTEQSLRQDLKRNKVADKDIEIYVKRARAAGRI